jgi:hypothetical protein
MAVSARDLEEVERLDQAAPKDDASTGRLAALESVTSLFAYLATAARADDPDPADECELLVRYARMPPDEVRRVAANLKALGFTEVAQRLAEVAGRRRHGLRPL